MAYGEDDSARFYELYTAIESRKVHDFSAPTYKDSPDLKEMCDIVKKNVDFDAVSKEESIPDIDTVQTSSAILRYVLEAYDCMGRASLSVKYYPLLLILDVISVIYYMDRADSIEEDYYRAIKARNYYGSDDCADLTDIVSRCMTQENIGKQITRAKRVISSIKRDVAECTEEYLSVIDEVEEEIDDRKKTNSCMEIWALKTRLLKKRGIIWCSPAVLNPNVKFD